MVRPDAPLAAPCPTRLLSPTRMSTQPISEGAHHGRSCPGTAAVASEWAGCIYPGPSLLFRTEQESRCDVRGGRAGEDDPTTSCGYWSRTCRVNHPLRLPKADLSGK